MGCQYVKKYFESDKYLQHQSFHQYFSVFYSFPIVGWPAIETQSPLAVTSLRTTDCCTHGSQHRSLRYSSLLHRNLLSRFIGDFFHRNSL